MGRSDDKKRTLPGKPRQSTYSREEVIEAGEFETFGSGNARLPLPNMLMFDRIMHIDDTGGRYKKGEMCAELAAESLQHLRLRHSHRRLVDLHSPAPWQTARTQDEEARRGHRPARQLRLAA